MWWFLLIFEVLLMARKRRKPTLVYSPCCCLEPGGCFRAWIAVYRGGNPTPWHTRMWRFSRADAESALYDIEHFEAHDGSLCSAASLRVLASDIRRVLARTQVLELEQRQTLRIRRSA